MAASLGATNKERRAREYRYGRGWEKRKKTYGLRSSLSRSAIARQASLADERATSLRARANDVPVALDLDARGDVDLYRGGCSRRVEKPRLMQRRENRDGQVSETCLALSLCRSACS